MLASFYYYHRPPIHYQSIGQNGLPQFRLLCAMSWIMSISFVLNLNCCISVFFLFFWLTFGCSFLLLSDVPCRRMRNLGNKSMAIQNCFSFFNTFTLNPNFNFLIFEIKWCVLFFIIRRHFLIAFKCLCLHFCFYILENICISGKYILYLRGYCQLIFI